MTIHTYKFTEPFLPRLADHICREHAREGADLGRLAVVFGGKRPALFLKRELARRLGQGFAAPGFFTIDEWMRYVVNKNESFTPGQDLNQCYFLYNLARALTPDILRRRETFARFLPWTREILSFIEQLDLENVDNEKLTQVQENARIGYPVPPDINRLLEKIVVLREGVHRHMRDTKVYSRGFRYLRAAELIGTTAFNEFDRVLLCNFFYLNRSEEAVIKSLHDRGLADLFFQGDERRWPVFRRTARLLDTPIREGEEVARPSFNLTLHEGFDVHSQVGIVRQLLDKSPAREGTVIVLPEAGHIIPLLSTTAPVLEEFNVSMGYPLKRSSLYSLLEFIFQAQLSRKGETYYARDYLKVLRHPLVKNLKFHDEPAVSRVLVHKIEEILTGKHLTGISGSLFIALEDLGSSSDLYELARRTLDGMRIRADNAGLKAVLARIHETVFAQWEEVGDFGRFAAVLRTFMNVFLKKSALARYPLNLKIAERVLSLCDELETCAFRGEAFPDEDLFRIFASHVEREMVSFSGSPLRGLQVLGLFETRALNFDNVIVMDVNEGVLPRLNVYEPLIPREVMIGLNLDRLEQEEEIQRYQFMRLIASAKNVHLVYQESKDRERSRFVEELVWDAEQERGRLGAARAAAAGFSVSIFPVRKEAKKTPAMVDFLKSFTYSASSVDTYLRNPWEFYVNYVLGLRETEDLLDEPENRQVGTFIHELLEETFKKFAGRKPVIDEKFRKYFQKTLDDRFGRTFGRSMKSEAFLLKSVIDERMARFLQKEAASPERAVKEVLFLEQSFRDTIDLPCGKMKFVFKLDRVDRMENGSVLLVDYKTGSVDPVPKGLDKIEGMGPGRAAVRENVKSFQLPLYYYYLNKRFPGEEINAAFYNLRLAELHGFVKRDLNAPVERITEAFLKPLGFIMAEILDPGTGFVDEEL